MEGVDYFVNLNLIGIIVGLVGVVSGFIFFIKSKKYKRLCYSISSENIINNVTEKFPSLEVKHDKKK